MPEVRIAFTSCADTDQDTVQPIWDAIAAKNPDYVLFLGDVIYMDWGLWMFKDQPRKWLKKGVDGYLRFAQTMYERYRAQWAVSSFRGMLNRLGNTEELRRERFLCTWDNHDFAWNESCGLDLPGSNPNSLHNDVVPRRAKFISKSLQRQFVSACLEQPIDYPGFDETMLRSDWEQAYEDRGLEATISVSQLQGVEIELLDTRWYRTPFADRPDALLLGEAQLHRLEQSVQRAERRLSIIASSVPYHIDYKTGRSEGWNGNGMTRPDFTRVQSLLHGKPTLRNTVVFLGGDTHSNDRRVPDSLVYRQFISSPVVKRAGTDMNFGLLTLSGEATVGAVTCMVDQFTSTSSIFALDPKFPTYSWSTHVN